MTATFTLNNELNGIEIKFDAKPAADILASIKELGFRWHNKKKIWYAKQTDERLAIAKEIAGGDVPVVATKSKAAKPKEKVNKYGVKVGDMFYASWGYEQTNVDFFQVIALKGETSVIIREVVPKRISDEPTCSMAADRAYEVSKEILPPVKNSCFVNDNENGDLKRVRSYGSTTCITVGRKGGYQTTAYPYNGEKVYESWYA